MYYVLVHVHGTYSFLKSMREWQQLTNACARPSVNNEPASASILRTWPSTDRTSALLSGFVDPPSMVVCANTTTHSNCVSSSTTRYGTMTVLMRLATTMMMTMMLVVIQCRRW